jgi:hypothetical protein
VALGEITSQHGQEMTLLSNAGGGANFDTSGRKKSEAEITVFLDGPGVQNEEGWTASGLSPSKR